MSDFQRFPVQLYNSLTRKKETFEPVAPPHVGLYVCGPTVYGEPHLGHARAAITFDLVFRYLEHLGYRVRYVRNITDVGHLEDEELDEGEDKIVKKARLEKVEPMEIVQRYTLDYHRGMDALNCRRPSIEPSASGHIIEQIQMVRKILDNDLAYEVNGSIYFDLEKYAASHPYGKLSGKVLDELQSGSRQTEGLDEKRHPHDFALWKRAEPAHIMRWESPWGEGFPGWHLECSTMSTKYLGEQFDIHGGGMDLQFPHHEAEIAQCRGAYGKDPARFWMHNNMVTIDGAKMSKSAGNFISLDQLFAGDHPLLSSSYHPMVVRFLMLQSHYRSEIDFSDDALQAAERGCRRLMEPLKRVDDLPEVNGAEGAALDSQIRSWCSECYETMSDDFNSARTLAILFEITGVINGLLHRQISTDRISPAVLEEMTETFRTFVTEILGLEPVEESDERRTGQLVDILIDLRARARVTKDFETADKIRDDLAEIGIRLKDGKDGKTSFEIDA